ncbi:hypothetical protein N7540_008233, partial [Penicillium herquei]
SVKVHREILMMRIMNTITDKSDWDRKVFDEEILSKWREEISQTGQDVSPAMMDYIIQELQWKAGLFKKDQSTTVFDMGVVKSDTAIPEELRRALVNAVFHLEDVLDEEKDYHPGTDEKVLDLVHPSLFPLVYGRTRILPDRTINLENCLGNVGQGELLPNPEMNEGRLRGIKRYSNKFQWLPCDVSLNAAEPDSVRIVSYINNLHPIEHRGLYRIIEKVISRAIPLWNKTFSEEYYLPDRIFYGDVEYEEHPEPEPVQKDGEDDNTFWTRHEEWEKTQPIQQPEPRAFEASAREIEEFDIQKLFGATGLQVIVKLANVELTPEKPEYGGGSWHIEGQLNERICATALYYYDSENITESTLAFRQRINEEKISETGYEQGRHEFLQKIYGLTDTDPYDETQATQNLGSVVCRQGRLLTFPNVIQHCVSPFSLEDRSKPGHRKILALFLVDPHLKIISTANIPPQQEDWGKEKTHLVGGMLSSRLPAELQHMVHNEGILQPLMSTEEAKRLRLELMEERSISSQAQNEEFEMGHFNLCEH